MCALLSADQNKVFLSVLFWKIHFSYETDNAPSSVQNCPWPPYSRHDPSSSFLSFCSSEQVWGEIGLLLKWLGYMQQHNVKVSQWAPPDFLRQLFVLSAVFCANWGVKPSSLTFRGTDAAVDPWKRPWALSPPAAAGKPVTGMSNELNTAKSLNSFFSTPRLSLSLCLRLWFIDSL